MLRYCLTLLFSIFLVLPARAQTPAETLSGILDALHTFQATFTETVQDGKGRVVQHASGQLALQRPGKFRWETRSPSKQLLIADGQKVWFYDVDLEQVTVQKQSTQTQNSPAMLLSGSTQALVQAFHITQLSPKNTEKGQWFQLTPKHKNLFQTVQLYFVGNELRAMNLTDHLGQLSRLTFTKVNINPEFSEQLFHFVPPHGVDVIRQAS